MADWAKIKAEYISGSSLKDLSEKYDVSYTYLQKISSKEKWKKNRSEKGQKRVRKIVDACATKEARKACNEIDISEILLGKLYQGVQEIRPDELDKLYTAASVLQKIKDAKKGLTEKDLEEQSARIAKLRREAERDQEQENNEIVFRITGMSDEEVQGVIG